MEGQKTLFEKYGGFDGIAGVVKIFYDLVLADETVSHFFKEVNMNKQRQHQTNFISFCLGGPNKYNGRNMREAHAHLNLKEEHFAAIAKHLTQALRTGGVSEDDITAILKVVATTHDEVLNL